MISRFAQRAEDLGYHSLWVQDRFMGRTTWLEPLGLLSFAAGVTYDIRLGVATMPLPWHNPARLAKSLASLDQLSGGRLIAGLSLGGYYVNENLPGTAPERRVAAFNEGLEVMRRLWTEEDVTLDGAFWPLRNATLDPKPAQDNGRGHMPIYLGGGSAGAIRRAVRVADGWIGASSSTLETFREQAALVREALEAAGRDPATFTIAKRQFLALDDSVERGDGADAPLGGAQHRERGPGRARQPAGAERHGGGGVAGDRRRGGGPGGAEPRGRPAGAGGAPGAGDGVGERRSVGGAPHPNLPPLAGEGA